jgi:hypothetical protein
MDNPESPDDTKDDQSPTESDDPLLAPEGPDDRPNDPWNDKKYVSKRWVSVTVALISSALGIIFGIRSMAASPTATSHDPIISSEFPTEDPIISGGPVSDDPIISGAFPLERTGVPCLLLDGELEDLIGPGVTGRADPERAVCDIYLSQVAIGYVFAARAPSQTRALEYIHDQTAYSTVALLPGLGDAAVYADIPPEVGIKVARGSLVFCITVVSGVPTVSPSIDVWRTAAQRALPRL